MKVSFKQSRIPTLRLAEYKGGTVAQKQSARCTAVVDALLILPRLAIIRVYYDFG